MFTNKRRRRRRRENIRNRRPKICRFCEDKMHYIDFKDANLLVRFVTEKGKIIPRRITGTCPYHQDFLRKAIVRARVISFLQ